MVTGQHATTCHILTWQYCHVIMGDLEGLIAGSVIIHIARRSARPFRIALLPDAPRGLLGPRYCQTLRAAFWDRVVACRGLGRLSGGVYVTQKGTRIGV